MTRLADLAPLLGQPIAGSVPTATLHGAPRSTCRAPTAGRRRLDAEGVAASGGFGGSVASQTARRALRSTAIDVAAATAALPDLQGAPARLSAAAKVDAARPDGEPGIPAGRLATADAASAGAGADRLLRRGHDRPAAARTAPGRARGVRARRRVARSDRVAAQPAGRPASRRRIRATARSRRMPGSPARRHGRPARYA